jgi:(E)-4-hydroxy-3-methylbut-2-enyl-diphosphate synthase
MARFSDYPFHLGMTATGLATYGIVKSAISSGILLSQGIGDTIRISLTDNPQEEVRIARIILQTIGLRNFEPEIISCPTCGRCEVGLVKVARELEKKISTFNCRLQRLPLEVAVMGCMVNGPGEAKEADMGIAFGKREGLFFKRGRPIRKIPVNRCVAQLVREIRKINN